MPTDGRSSPKVRDIVAVLDEIAPPALAESWDNVGLLVGDPEAEPAWVAVALDAACALAGDMPGPEVGPGLLVAHHPVPFRPLGRLLAGDPVADLVATLLRRGISLYAAHTNFDSAPGGLSHVLAADLGLDPGDLRSLAPAAQASREAGGDPAGGAGASGFYKLVVFVPATHTAAVRAALAEAGAGWIGDYSDTAFAAPGHGYFRPLEGSRPFIGAAGQVEEVVEDRLETIVPVYRLRAVVRRMLEAHPYEEAAYDVYPLASHPAVTRPELLTGLGRVGRLVAGEVELADYKLMVERALGLPPGAARLLGHGPAAARGAEAFGSSGARGARRVARRVAVCPGAGGGYVRRAAAAGADVYVTGDLTYHHAVEACQLGLALIDAGHHGTEKVFTRTMAALLGQGLASEGISLDVSEVPLPSGWLL